VVGTVTDVHADDARPATSARPRSAGHRTGVRVAVVVASDRCASGQTEDRSGARAVDLLRAAGHDVLPVVVVPDGAASVGDAVAEAARTADVVLTSGGTGIGPRDETPEGTRPLLARELPGIAEALRRHGEAHVATAVLSRGLAGVTASGVLVVNLPGSTRAVEQGLEVLLPLLPHVVAQVRGGDHDAPRDR
jgi:molybdenum cofactor synthesis domain-containing protein